MCYWVKALNQSFPIDAEIINKKSHFTYHKNPMRLLYIYSVDVKFAANHRTIKALHMKSIHVA